VLPTATEPKEMDDGDSEMPPVEFWLDGFGAPPRPMQPEIESSPANKTSRQPQRAMLLAVQT